MMQKKILRLILLSGLLFLLTACSKEKEPDYTDYINNVEPIFNELENLDSKIRSIEAASEDSLSELLTCLDDMSKIFERLSMVNPPDEFYKTQSLAKEAADYLNQARDYFEGAFRETEINETRLNNAIECYNRANKRLHYIIKLLHNELITE